MWILTLLYWGWVRVTLLEIHCNILPFLPPQPVTRLQQCKPSALTHSGTHSHMQTQVYMELRGPFVEWWAVWSGGEGEGEVERGRSGEGRQRCGGEDKLDVQKQTVFVPEAQWVNACVTKQSSSVETCVCECGGGWVSFSVLCSQVSAVV